MTEQQQQQKKGPVQPVDFSGSLIKEFRITLPLTVEEYQVAQLYSVAEASKNETGGGEGIEVLKNEPFNETHLPPYLPLLGGKYTTGQYTHKIYHLASKVPTFIRLLAPKGSLEIHEEAWNAYPYCRTIISNPGYMEEAFYIIIDTYHLPYNSEEGEIENAHQLGPTELKKRELVNVDIAHDKVQQSDYKEATDPTKYKSEKTGRGPLTSTNWKNEMKPVMCAYKLVRAKFKWFGLQGRVEKFIMKQEQRIFTNFNREVFCWMDKWYGMTMEDIRALEDKTKEELDQCRKTGEVRGTTAADKD